MQPVAQVFHVALEGGARDVEFVEEDLDRHQAALVQHLVDAVETFGAVHRLIPVMNVCLRSGPSLYQQMNATRLLAQFMS